jgi:hypothetical protein
MKQRNETMMMNATESLRDKHWVNIRNFIYDNCNAPDSAQVEVSQKLKDDVFLINVFEGLCQYGAFRVNVRKGTMEKKRGNRFYSI